MSGQPVILNIKMVPAGVDLVIGALRKLPHEQVDDLVREIWDQYKAQMTAIAQATVAAPMPEPEPDEEKGSEA